MMSVALLLFQGLGLALLGCKTVAEIKDRDQLVVIGHNLLKCGQKLP